MFREKSLLICDKEKVIDHCPQDEVRWVEDPTSNKVGEGSFEDHKSGKVYGLV